MPTTLTRLRIHSGRIVAAQVAVALLVAGAGRPAALPVGAAVLAVTFGRFRGRWWYRWLTAAAGVAARRRRTAAAGPDPVAVLAAARPGVQATEVPLNPASTGGHATAVALTDAYGTVVLLALDHAEVVPGHPVALPAMPDFAVQLLVTGVAAPAGPGPAAASYRQLTGAGALTVRQTLLAVRVPAGGDPRRTVNQVQRRLAPRPARPVAPGELPAVLAVLGCASPVRETWSALLAGGVRQVAYQPDGAAADPAGAVTRWLSAPGSAITTVSVTGDGVTARLAADPVAGAALPAPPPGYRLDGDHLRGFAATLPLALATPYPAGRAAGRAAGPTRPVRVGPAGLMLGRDEAGEPVWAALFRRRAARVVLVGGAGARLLAWRALGAGARVLVRTASPHGWHDLARAEAAGRLVLVRPDAGAPFGGGPLRPTLLIDDNPGSGSPGSGNLGSGSPGSGSPGSGSPAPPAGWCAEVLVRPGVSAEELELLARADLVLARRLADREATMVSAALGLGSAGAELRRPAAAALAVIAGGGVRWVRPCLTGAERDLRGVAGADLSGGPATGVVP